MTAKWIVQNCSPSLSALLAEMVGDANLGEAHGAPAIHVFEADDGAHIQAAQQAAQKIKQNRISDICLIVLPAEKEKQVAELKNDFAEIFIKPFSLPECLEKANRALRLHYFKTHQQLEESLHYDPITRLLTHTDTQTGKMAEQILSAREADFLLAVVAASQNNSETKGLSRLQAMRDVWGFHQDADSHAVETTVYRLRQKLNVIFGSTEKLISEDGLYRWI